MEVADSITAARRVFYECSQVCRSSDVSRSLVPDSGLACTECGLYHAVLREASEEPHRRSLSYTVVNFSGSLLLQDRVAVHSQNVIDAADSQTLGGGQIPSAGPGRAERVRALLD